MSKKYITYHRNAVRYPKEPICEEEVIWEEDNNDGSIRDIVLSTDGRSYTDKLTFVVNILNPQYDNIRAGVINIIKYVDDDEKVHTFFIVRVEQSDIMPERTITCVSQGIYADWTPMVPFEEFYYYANGYDVDPPSDLVESVNLIGTYFKPIFNIISASYFPGTSKISVSLPNFNKYFGKYFSEYVKETFTNRDILISRYNSEVSGYGDITDYYYCSTIYQLSKDREPTVVITKPQYIKSYNYVEDITNLYTRGFSYCKWKNDETGVEAYATKGRIYKPGYPEVVYGAKTMVADASETSENEADLALATLGVNTSKTEEVTLTILPLSPELQKVKIGDIIEVAISEKSINIHARYIVVSKDEYIDKPTDTSIAVNVIDKFDTPGERISKFQLDISKMQ